MSEIPEGATHKSEEGNYIKASGEDVSCFINDEWESVCSLVMLGAMNLTPIKQDKEMIYTKEMHEAGELPKVGMMVSTEAGEYVVLLINDKEIVFEDEQGFYISINKHKVKPIDTRTDTEKAIDDIKKLLISVAEKSFDVTAQVILEKAIAGKIHGVTFTGDK